jgi:hypothetical protein
MFHLGHRVLSRKNDLYAVYFRLPAGKIGNPGPGKDISPQRTQRAQRKNTGKSNRKFPASSKILFSFAPVASFAVK